ncbi:hypothetical protein Mal64_05690 [Pseudobythopirellula maris]|uniref:Uncharacterized protein n=1 Tax=Pseudobythopirellula maris TaxID=2527991 RepID=A0A5C5ZT32_9BACT|nr:hypothetical protein [Pseudobythopirellula maris]TWT90185.1 hypothetical protein Mal64_05690 [Pseudobythopirellula maris]
MKAISASIVVLAGALLLAVGSITNTDTGWFVMLVGFGVGLLGLWGWQAAFLEK